MESGKNIVCERSIQEAAERVRGKLISVKTKNKKLRRLRFNIGKLNLYGVVIVFVKF